MSNPRIESYSTNKHIVYLSSSSNDPEYQIEIKQHLSRALAVKPENIKLKGTDSLGNLVFTI